MPSSHVEIIGLPWPSFLAAIRASRLPICHQRLGRGHPRPAQLGAALPGRHLCGPPEVARRRWFAVPGELVIAGVAGTTDAEREAVYSKSNQMDYDERARASAWR